MADFNAEEFGRAIASRRVRLGLRQAELARRARVTQTTIARLETGQLPRVSFETVRRVAAALGVSLDALAEEGRRSTFWPPDAVMVGSRPASGVTLLP